MEKNCMKHWSDYWCPKCKIHLYVLFILKKKNLPTFLEWSKEEVWRFLYLLMVTHKPYIYRWSYIYIYIYIYIIKKNVTHKSKASKSVGGRMTGISDVTLAVSMEEDFRIRSFKKGSWYTFAFKFRYIFLFAINFLDVGRVEIKLFLQVVAYKGTLVITNG